MLLYILIAFFSSPTTALPLSQPRSAPTRPRSTPIPTRTQPTPIRRPTPTPCPTSKAPGQTRQISPGRGVPCKGVPIKATVVVPGGDIGGLMCNGFDTLAPTGVPVWEIYPSVGEVQLGKPHVYHDLIAKLCYLTPHPDFEVDFTLTGPNGHLVTREHGSTNLNLDSANFFYDFPPGSPTGKYQLTIQGDFGIITRELTVALYEGPKLTLSNPTTEQKFQASKNHRFEVTNPIRVDYTGFAKNSTVEAAIYNDSGEMLNSWLFQSNEQGRFDEILRFDPTQEVKGFLLAACETDDCALIFFTGGEPYYENGIGPQPIVWESFHILPDCPGAPLPHVHVGAAEVITTDILHLRSNPGVEYKIIGQLKKGTRIDIQDGPKCAQAKGKNAYWWQVSIAETGLEGWVVDGSDDKDPVYLRNLDE